MLPCTICTKTTFSLYAETALQSGNAEPLATNSRSLLRSGVAEAVVRGLHLSPVGLPFQDRFIRIRYESIPCSSRRRRPSRLAEAHGTSFRFPPKTFPQKTKKYKKIYIQLKFSEGFPRAFQWHLHRLFNRFICCKVCGDAVAKPVVILQKIPPPPAGGLSSSSALLALLPHFPGLEPAGWAGAVGSCLG